jgi:hypothetical protein
VVDEETVAGVLGLSVVLPPAGDESARMNELKEVFERMKGPHLNGNAAFASASSPYGMEVLVLRAGKDESCPLRIEQGVAFAPLQRSDVYALRLVNNADHEAAASVTIDGLDLFSFSDVKPAALILKPHSSAIIRGWPITLKKSNQFLVTSYAESAAFQQPVRGDVGVLNASFSAAWPVKGTPPADEPRQPTRGSIASNATGHGAPIGQEYQAVERQVGVLRASVSIRYSH